MSEYLKMADVFNVGVNQGEHELYLIDGKDNLIATFEDGREKQCQYAIYAIKNHDALVSEVERLRVLLGDCKDLIESSGFKHGFGNNDMNNVLNSIDLELSKK